MFKNKCWIVFFLSVFGPSSVRAEPEPQTQAQPESAATPSAQPPKDKEMVVEVKAKRRMIQHSASVSKVEVDQEQIRMLPQGSEVSLPKLVSTITPGAVAGPFGQIFFRGNHAHIQYQIDGIQMPESPSTTFGQAFSPRNIERMEVITGGIPAEFGQRLGAVVNITTKTGPITPEGEIELNYGSYNTVSPHLLYGGSNESGNLHYFLSLNYNSTDRGIDTPQPQSQDDIAQGGKDSVHNYASGNSEFARIDWQAGNSDKVSFALFHAESNFQIPNFPSSFGPNDAYFSKDYTVFGKEGEDGHPIFVYVPPNTNDTQAERNAYGQAVWKHTLTNSSFLQFAPYYKYSSIKVNNDPTNDLATSSTGATPVSGAEPISIGMDRHINQLGFKGDFSFRPFESHLVKTGFQVQASRSDGSISVQKELTGPVYSDSLGNTGYFEGVYIQDDYTIVKPLVLNAGLRYDATQFMFSDVVSTDSMLQPRVGLNYSLTETTKFHIFYGKLFQPAPVENLRVTFSRVHEKPTAYDIKAQKDDFYEAGVDQQILDKQLVSLNVYYRDSINVLDHGNLPRTSISQPFNFAKGFAYGAEISLRGQLTEEWSEFLNYSYSIAKGEGISGGAWAGETPESPGYQFLDHVQVHTANGALTYQKKYFWWTGQGRYGSGLRTGSANSLDLPGHLTWDTTVGYEFHGDSWLSRFRLSFDVLNIFDNVYPITIANSFNASQYAAGRMFFLRFAKSL